MRSFWLAVLVLGCSSNAKQPVGPTPGEDGTGTGTGTGDPGGNQGSMPEPPPPPPDTGGYRLVTPSALKWMPLDPNAKAGPELAVVSGDPQRGSSSVFLRLPPGTKPGLHTHTSDYHAVVVGGAPKHWIAGEEKKAQPLGPGSYWFQPANQPHGDECTGTEPCLLYLVLTGAFDFTPTPNAKPVKPGQYLLVASKDLKFQPLDPKQPDGFKLALVSGDPKTGPVQYVIDVPPGLSSGLHSHTSDYHAIVVQGAPAHWLPHEANEGEPLEPGTYWFQPGGYDHGDRCTGSVPCRTFIMLPKPLDVKPPGAGK